MQTTSTHDAADILDRVKTCLCVREKNGMRDF